MIKNFRFFPYWSSSFNRTFFDPKGQAKKILQSIKATIEKGKKQFQKGDYQEYPKKMNNASYLVIAVAVISALIYVGKRPKCQQISLQQFKSALDRSSIDSIYVSKVQKDSDIFKLSFSVNGIQQQYYTSDLIETQKCISQIQQTKAFKTKIIMNTGQTIDETFKDYIKTAAKLVMPILFPIMLYNSRLGMIFKSKFLGQAETLNKPNVLFKDIAGLGNAKIQVSQLVDFLKRPQKYKKIGAKIPKGALLAGPPGTGKTMLAKACAGQANVPFFSVSGSEFVQLFAGMGAHRVRQLFQKAKQQTPAIIFIDEIDAVGRKRSDKFGSANDERANTLNQLLVEMDGFGTSDDIIVLAATNRKQMLDEALTRPGRFDRIVQIQLPDLKGRKQILEIYLKKISLSPVKTINQYAKRLATLTFGFSGADLANLCNEAAILAVRQQKKHVEAADFQNASDRVLAGLEQSTALSDIEKRKVAYHECGHAVTAWFLQGASPLLKITIVPRSKGALGFAQYLPNESSLATKQDLIDQMCVILGGRISEEIFFGQVSNGASDDLQKVRRLAYAIVVTYGMSNKFNNYAPVQTDGHNIYSETTAAEIDKEIIELIGKCTEKTREILKQHSDKIRGLAEAVIKKESLNHQEIRQILGERPFPSKQNYREFIEEIQSQKKAQILV